MQKLILRCYLGKCTQVLAQDVPTAALNLFNTILHGYSFDTESCPFYFMGLSGLIPVTSIQVSREEEE